MKPGARLTVIMTLAASAFALVLTAGSLKAQLAYSVSREFTGEGDLYQLDLEALTLQAVGSLGVGDVIFGALDQSEDGPIYAIGVAGVLQPRSLYRLDPVSGHATSIGTLELDNPTGLSVGPQGHLWVVSGTQLDRVDPLTGQTISSLTLSEEVYALASSEERLHGISSPGPIHTLWQIDTSNGDLVYISVLDGVGMHDIYADFDESGVLWLIGTSPGPVMFMLFVSFYKVPNPEDGQAIETFSTVVEFGDPDPLGWCRGLAMLPSPALSTVEIPTIAMPGLLFLMSSLALFGLLHIKRRRAGVKYLE